MSGSIPAFNRDRKSKDHNSRTRWQRSLRRSAPIAGIWSEGLPTRARTLWDCPVQNVPIARALSDRVEPPDR